MIARVSPRTGTKTGDDIEIALDAQRMYLFDAATEENILFTE